MNRPLVPPYATRPDPLDELDVFFGHTSAALARVYARLPAVGWPADAKLGGYLRGPLCRYSQTLPEKLPFRDLGPGETRLAEALVTEACFWTPDSPMLYEAHIELRLGNEVLASATRALGIRPFGVRDGVLVWDGKPWRLRGASVSDATAQTQWEAARDLGLTLVVSEPSQALCVLASQWGVPLVARFDHLPANATTNTIADAVRYASRWPCIVLAIVPPGWIADPTLAARVPNLPWAMESGAELEDTSATMSSETKAHAREWRIVGLDQTPPNDRPWLWRTTAGEASEVTDPQVAVERLSAIEAKLPAPGLGVILG